MSRTGQKEHRFGSEGIEMPSTTVGMQAEAAGFAATQCRHVQSYTGRGAGVS